MTNTISFDMGQGPDLKGTWKNYKTGEVITIRDTIFENNQLVGVTSGGLMVPYNRLQSFVQCDPSEAQEPVVNQSPKKKAPMKFFVDNIESDNYEQTSVATAVNDISNIDPPVREIQDISSIKPKTDNSPITKVLDGLSGKDIPKINIDIKWDEIPEGIIFLKKYLGVSNNDLIDAICKKYINIDDILDKLETKLSSIIEKSLNPKEIKETKKSK